MKKLKVTKLKIGREAIRVLDQKMQINGGAPSALSRCCTGADTQCNPVTLLKPC